MGIGRKNVRLHPVHKQAVGRVILFSKKAGVAVVGNSGLVSCGSLVVWKYHEATFFISPPQ
jgi:hypothetical protein